MTSDARLAAERSRTVSTLRQFSQRLPPLAAGVVEPHDSSLLASVSRNVGKSSLGAFRNDDDQASRRCESSNPLSRITSRLCSGVNPKFSRSLM